MIVKINFTDEANRFCTCVLFMQNGERYMLRKEMLWPLDWPHVPTLRSMAWHLKQEMSCKRWKEKPHTTAWVKLPDLKPVAAA